MATTPPAPPPVPPGLRSLLLLLLLFPALTLTAPLEGLGARRVQLHIHLDGSVPVETLLRVAQVRNLTIPGIGKPSSVDDIWRVLRNVTSIWHRFDIVNDIIGGDSQILSEIAEAFVERQAEQGVVYTEVRYDPVRMAVSHYANISITEEEAVAAITDGLRKGSLKNGVESYSLLCAMRGKPSSACFEVAALASRFRSADLGGVVGLDLAGDEPDFDNIAYIDCFRHAKEQLGLNTTVHAGEAVRPVDVLTAIKEMKVDRIGHGYAGVKDPQVLEAMVQSGVHFEACPPGAKRKGVLDSILVYKEHGLSFGINEDDPTVYFENTTMTGCEDILIEDLGFSRKDIEEAYASARDARFG